MIHESLTQRVRLAVLVAALGYFVDFYDLVLFNVIRLTSLKSLGITGDSALKESIFLINMQMGGMLLGGIVWGALAASAEDVANRPVKARHAAIATVSQRS